jgi:HEAT repeat protein
LQVSRALNRLLGKEPKFGDHQLAAQALQRWGTEDNVEPLLAALRSREEWDRAPRIELCRALGEIGDDRAIVPVASQLENAFVRMNGLEKVLIRFGAKAEPEVLKHIQSGDVFTRRAVCDVLKEIGSTASIEPLENAAKDFPVKRNAEAALAAVKARVK